MLAPEAGGAIGPRAVDALAKETKVRRWEDRAPKNNAPR
jgi:hypothetical protein